MLHAFCHVAQQEVRGIDRSAYVCLVEDDPIFEVGPSSVDADPNWPDPLRLALARHAAASRGHEQMPSASP